MPRKKTKYSTTNYAQKINNRPVVNGARRVKLHISAADAKGGKKDPANCAAAKAALREVPNCVAARVHIGRVYLLKKDGNWHRYKTPDALRTEIVSFDRGGTFEPGEYELMPMSASDMPENRRKYAEARKGRAGPDTDVGKLPRKLHVTQGVRPRATIYKE